MALEFEWDPRKADRNEQKHGVSFTEAATAFADLRSISIADPGHSLFEERHLLLGRTAQGRLIVVSHTTRGDRFRLISARMASRYERKVYEEDPTQEARDS